MFLVFNLIYLIANEIKVKPALPFLLCTVLRSRFHLPFHVFFYGSQNNILLFHFIKESLSFNLHLIQINKKLELNLYLPAATKTFTPLGHSGFRSTHFYFLLYASFMGFSVDNDTLGTKNE